LDVLIELGEHLGEGGQGLDAGIPWLDVGSGCYLLGSCGALRLPPTIGVDYLQGIGRCGEDLCDEDVGIESDGSDQLLELLGVEGLCGRLLLWGIWLLLVWLRGDWVGLLWVGLGVRLRRRLSVGLWLDVA
jgi:hypothetical protein